MTKLVKTTFILTSEDIQNMLDNYGYQYQSFIMVPQKGVRFKIRAKLGVITLNAYDTANRPCVVMQGARSNKLFRLLKESESIKLTGRAKGLFE